MWTGEIALCLHFDQPARGALKLEPQPIATIQRVRRRCRRYHELDAAIVELIDRRDEAARGVLVEFGEWGNIRNEDRVTQACELDVVVLAARPFEKCGELEPRHPRARGQRRDVPVFDDESLRSRGRVAGQPREAAAQ